MSTETIDTRIAELEVIKSMQTDEKVLAKDIKIASDGAVASIKGKEFEVSKVGIMSLIKALKMPASYFRRYPVEGEFTEHANTLLKASDNREILVRTQGAQVRAFLPNTYGIFDDIDVLRAIKAHEVKFPNYDMHMLRHEDAVSTCMIRFGNALTVADEIYPMFRFSNSETGFNNLIIEMGLFRLVCTNGMVRKQSEFGYMKWAHTLKNFTKVSQFIDFSMSRGLDKVGQMQLKFEEARTELIKIPVPRIIGDLLDRKRVSRKFATEMLKANEATPFTTKFELINHITQKAQDERSWASRTRYEALGAQILDAELVA